MKGLYLTAIKKEIYKYEDVYHQAAHDSLVDKLGRTKIQGFETVEQVFKIEFPPLAQNQRKIEHAGSLEDMFYLCSEDKKLELVRNWLKRPPKVLFFRKEVMLILFLQNIGKTIHRYPLVFDIF
jgi:hypothetical protein